MSEPLSLRTNSASYTTDLEDFPQSISLGPKAIKPVDLGSPCRMAGANRRCGDEFRDKHCNTGFCNRTGWCGSAPRRDDQLAYGGGTCINGIKVKPVLRKVKKSSCKLESNGRCGRGHGNLICRRGYCDYYGYCSQSSVAKKWQQKEFSASASTGACRASLVNLSWQSESFGRCIHTGKSWSTCNNELEKESKKRQKNFDFSACRRKYSTYYCNRKAGRQATIDLEAHDYQSCVKIMTQARRIFRTTQWKSAMKKYCKKTYGPQSID